eukprot:TRINITY_DN896_c0_g1_i4.p1 TRINITY_DN896_c0_g1~~TRINITY_DN896_c0_g1_i4.p1  ORF type:complete len:110 (-),score=57.88 TRINITY_DN896_c0_g1_i4:33-362(-)
MRYLICRFFFFLMIRRPPRSTQSRSSAASDVYKRQYPSCMRSLPRWSSWTRAFINLDSLHTGVHVIHLSPVSYTHLRAHETVLDLVCRLLLEKKKKEDKKQTQHKKAYR